MKKTSYFTLGQRHLHRYNGQILDKDCVIKITDEDPREKMFELFSVRNLRLNTRKNPI